MILGDDVGTAAGLLKDGGPTVIAFAVLVVGAIVLAKYIAPIVANLTRLADNLERAIETAERSEVARELNRREEAAMFGSKLRQADEMLADAHKLLEPLKHKSRAGLAISEQSRDE